MQPSRLPDPQTPPDQLGVVSIGAREIYDEVIGLRSEVRSIGQQAEGVRAELDDHEDRIRQLEAWRYALPVAALTGVGGALVAIVQAVAK
ncbi:hypothetical protein OG401_23430 [Kitasatospora purpeofusca]|uniref:hypothetical protein n=1 Tax=Kitasatospora purpeofusca TaxID=67352 RepID=UPI00225004B2|nr:hypothetical protein [Kitasatospora purpeofusca]MCX4687220.1 hypothetical protein [Kitasatospora purpeofusca]